uniref:MHC class I-like antigen recognition-like domain-containing protein n=1 Tax=Neogobius melanostomus TaxID=47308 RepID=A0A8C6WU71_9GOBI
KAPVRLVLLPAPRQRVTSEAREITHSLRYFYTASRGIPSFPEFVTVGMVDEQPISYYDSNQKREVPKQEWMKQNEEPDYWERQTQISIAAEQRFKANTSSYVHTCFVSLPGPHIVQNLYGCEWDETGDVHGFNQFGYNGEDYIVFNLETETWIAPRSEAVITKMKWDRDETRIQVDKNYLTHTCVDWLRKSTGVAVVWSKRSSGNRLRSRDIRDCLLTFEMLII